MRVLLHGFAGRASDFACPKEVPESELWNGLVGKETFIPELSLDTKYLGCDLWELARTLLKEIKKHKGRPTLWGYSMGARIAWHMLVLEPEYFSSAVIMSGQVGLNSLAERKSRRVWELEWVSKWLNADWNKTWSEWKKLEVFGDIAHSLWGPALGEARWLDSDTDFLRKSFADAMSLRSLSVQDNLGPQLASVRTPVLVVTGAQDSKYLELAREIKSFNNQFNMSVVSRCGHRVVWDNTAEITNTIQLFEAKTLT